MVGERLRWMRPLLLDTDLVRIIFGAYFSAMGVMGVWKTALAISRATLSDRFWQRYTLREFPIDTPYFGRLFIRFRAPTVVIGILSLLPSILYLWLRRPAGSETTALHALLNNIIALSLAFTMLDIFKLDSFKTGCVLLTGLFLYDVWWVFGTPVMVDVAKGLEAPIILLWPRSLIPGSGFSMLGLGDIVIPGSFIATCLRFDHSRSRRTSESNKTASFSSFPKPYFKSSLFAYMIALTITSLVVQFAGHAQPALLYLSPACMGAFFYTARKRHELQEAMHWHNDLKGRSRPARADSEVAALETDVEVVSSVETLEGSAPEARRRDSFPPTV